MIWKKLNDFMYEAEKDGWVIFKEYINCKWRYSAQRNNEKITGSKKKVLSIVNYSKQQELW